MNCAVRAVYEFGPFRLDTGRRLLSRDGEAVPLMPKAFDTLVALVERGGEVVDKDELLERVWQGAVVEENNLTQKISMLRKALGETAGQHQYIVTLPGRGYSFVAAVRRADELLEVAGPARLPDEEPPVPHSAPSPEAAAPPIARRLGRRWLVAAVAVALLALAAAAPHFIAEPAPDAPPRSVAVLPFSTLGETPGDEYLRLGMADTLITKLSNVRRIVVRPTSAVVDYGGPHPDITAIGRRLGVEFVLEGKIQKLGSRLRVTVQLVKASDGSPLWAEKYDEEFTGILAVQDSISEQVARALLSRLDGGPEHEQFDKHYTANSEAHRLYLMGRYFWNKRTEDGLRKAADYFRQAIDEDPAYALAYAGLADCYNLLGHFNAMPPREAYSQARQAAIKALEIDEALAEAHTSLAHVRHRFEWDWAGAEAAFRRAIELKPNYAIAHHWYASFLSAMGRPDEAIEAGKRAQALDPLSLVIATNLGIIYHTAGRHAEARAQYERALEMDANFAVAHLALGQLCEAQGQYEQAIAEFRRAADLDPSPSILAALGRAYALAGRREPALEILGRLDRLSSRR